jgi:hypothetical protein
MSVNSINLNSQALPIKNFDRAKYTSNKSRILEESPVKPSSSIETNKNTNTIKSIWSNISSLFQLIGEKLGLVQAKNTKKKISLKEYNKKNGENIFEIKEISTHPNSKKQQSPSFSSTPIFVTSAPDHHKHVVDDSQDGSSIDGSSDHSCGLNSCGGSGCGSGCASG